MKEDKSVSSKNEKEHFFLYKGRPLIRHSDIIYYGNMAGGCVVKIRVKSTKNIGDIKLSKNVTVQLIDTDPNTPDAERIVRVSDKVGLYQALDVASTWLDKYAS